MATVQRPSTLPTRRNRPFVVAQHKPNCFGRIDIHSMKQMQMMISEQDARIGSDASAELQLNLALGDTILDTMGPHPEGTAAFNRALELSERVGSTMHRGRALSGLCAVRIGTGDYQSAVGFAESLRLIGEDYRDDSASFAPDWLISLAHHLAGDQVLARHHIERALMRPARHIAPSSDRPFQFDLAAAAHAVQEQGRACQARELLMSVYAKFTEGFETTDLIKARTLLE